MVEKSIQKNVFYNVLKTILSLIFPFISFPYVSRILGPAGLGKINFAGSIISYAIMFASLGIQAYGIREAAKKRDNKEELSVFIAEILRINFFSTIIAYIVLFCTVFFVPKFAEYRILLLLTSCNILFVTIGIDWLYSALEEYKYITSRSFITQLLSLIALFIFIKKPEDYLKYALISVCANSGSNLFNFFHSRKYINLFKFKAKNCRQHFKPILTMFGMTIAASIFTAMDTTMVGLLHSDYEVGIYGAAIKGVKLVNGLIATLGTTLLPRVSYYIGIGNLDRFNHLFKKSAHITLFLACPAVILIIFNGKIIVDILSGEQYYAAIRCIQIISGIILFSSFSLLIDNQILLPLGKEKLNLLALIVGAVTDFILNLLFIPKYGALGACIATLITEGLIFILHIFFVSKRYKLKEIMYIFYFYIIPSLAMVLIIYASIIFFDYSLVRNICISFFASIVYLAVLFILKCPILRKTEI
jgi:O-antigen/teichoic acid export membrane protein